jgi:hypothetical protein
MYPTSPSTWSFASPYNLFQCIPRWSNADHSGQCCLDVIQGETLKSRVGDNRCLTNADFEYVKWMLNNPNLDGTIKLSQEQPLSVWITCTNSSVRVYFEGIPNDIYPVGITHRTSDILVTNPNPITGSYGVVDACCFPGEEIIFAGATHNTMGKFRESHEVENGGRSCWRFHTLTQLADNTDNYRPENVYAICATGKISNAQKIVLQPGADGWFVPYPTYPAVIDACCPVGQYVLSGGTTAAPMHSIRSSFPVADHGRSCWRLATVNPSGVDVAPDNMIIKCYF